jgi:hypothetical protein
MKNYWIYGEIPIGRYPPNTESQFSPLDLDNEGNFNIHKPLGWSKDSFSYKYNSYGFRSREFDLNDPTPKILGLGCSHTVGVGIPSQDSWIEQFGSTYFKDHVVYNAGLGGAGADTVARLAVNMIPLIKPNIVAILWPSMYRFETYEGNAVFNGPWSDEPLNLQFEDNTAYNNQTKNKLIINLLQKIHNFKLLSIDYDSIHNVYETVVWSRGRDGNHYGPDWHRQVAFDFKLQYDIPNDWELKYTDPKEYWKKYKDKEVK